MELWDSNSAPVCPAIVDTLVRRSCRILHVSLLPSSPKTDPRTKHIPIVVLTSSREEEDLARSYNYGVNSYVVKPVDFPQFSDAVRQVGLYWMLLNQVPAELSA